MDDGPAIPSKVARRASCTSCVTSPRSSPAPAESCRAVFPATGRSEVAAAAAVAEAEAALLPRAEEVRPPRTDDARLLPAVSSRPGAAVGCLRCAETAGLPRAEVAGLPRLEVAGLSRGDARGLLRVVAAGVTSAVADLRRVDVASVPLGADEADRRPRICLGSSAPCPSMAGSRLRMKEKENMGTL
ncbi:hypothetical protein FJT64_009483 [Amphibalanus amphitrite]|uniref:Uncharacterized protein n=1 Tax=Amphibalanus amphitrite TaxID=1232801 RepID=A0A6A4VPA1_AMPAM|nr:hypothetical protein FJT64_009483 [Amphibalanus amphitrite]